MPNGESIWEGNLSRLPRNVRSSAAAAIFCLFGLSFLLIYLAGFVFDDDQDAPSESSAEIVIEEPPTELPSPPSPDQISEEVYAQQPQSPPPPDPTQLQQDAIRKAESIRVRSRAEQVRKNWQELKDKSNELQLTLQSLLTNSAGRQIASNPDLVKQFRTLQSKERTVPAEIDVIGEQLDILLAPLESISPSSLSNSLVAKIDELGQEIRPELGAVDQDLRLLKRLLAAAESQDAADGTLARHLELLSDRQAKAELDRLAAEKDRLRREEELRVQQAKAEEAKRRREYERLRSEALSPQVLSLLAPLVTPDYAQPRQITGMLAHGEKSPKKEGVSLTRLRTLGVLDENERGMKKLALLNTRKWTNRPRWQMEYNAPEPGLWTPQQFEMIRKAQEYLNKYGDILVQEGKLAP